MNVCVNLKCLININDRKFLRKLLLYILIQKITFLISIREIDKKSIKINNYIIVKLAFYNKLNDVYIKRIVTIEIHIIDDFAINFFLNNDVLYSKKINFNLD